MHCNSQLNHERPRQRRFERSGKLRRSHSDPSSMRGRPSLFPLLAKDEESIMAPKEHGTSKSPVQENLRWGCNYELADSLCNFNSLKRGKFEPAGYWRQTAFFEEAKNFQKEDRGAMTFYDSNSGKPLFRAPQQRSWDDFLQEASVHGWLSFRDEEIIWENVRCLKRGMLTVSLAGTHLGSNMPDRKGNRYCINLVAIAGHPAEEPLLLNWTHKSETGERDESTLNFLNKAPLSFDEEKSHPEWFESQRTWIQDLTTDEVIYTPWQKEDDDAPENDSSNDEENDKIDDDQSGAFVPWPAAPCPKLPFGVETVDNQRRRRHSSFIKIENTALLLAAKNCSSKQERDACSFGSCGSTSGDDMEEKSDSSYQAWPEETFMQRSTHKR